MPVPNESLPASRRLGRTPLQVSSIGMGCVTFGREIDAPTSFTVMDRALERGITHFDTAEAYNAGASEVVVGRWMAERGTRDRIVLATKVAGRLTRERVLTSAESSLRRLRTDRIDLFYLHAWPAEVELDEPLSALDQLVRQGKVRHVAGCNALAWQVCKALWRQDRNGWSRFEAVQVNYNLVRRDIEPELLPLAADQQLGVVTYSPLGAGFLTGKYVRGGAIPKGTRFDVIPGHQSIYCHDAGFRVVEALQAHSDRVGVPMTLLALAWVLNRPGVTCTLIGARSPAQVDQVFEAQGLDSDLRFDADAR